MDKKIIVEKIKESLKLLEGCLLEINLQDKDFSEIKNNRKIEKTEKIDFSINERAFFKKYSKDISSGPAIFTLMVAYIVKGKENSEISISDVQKLWKKVDGIFTSKYASIYATRARGNDWVDTKKSGMYILRPNWNQIFY